MSEPEGSDVLHESQPEENDGHGEEPQTERVQMVGGVENVRHVDAEGRRQQTVHQPIKDVPAEEVQRSHITKHVRESRAGCCRTTHPGCNFLSSYEPS